MIFTIITPSLSYEHSVEWVELNTPTGNYVILEGHAPMVLVLQPESNYSYLINAERDAITRPLSKGIAHITRTQVTLILES